jgi:hypothetical protein
MQRDEPLRGIVRGSLRGIRRSEIDAERQGLLGVGYSLPAKARASCAISR